jgi:hypothetical protein
MFRQVLFVSLAAGMVFPIGSCARIARAQDDWDAAKKPVGPPDQNGVFQLPDFNSSFFGERTRAETERILKSQLAVNVEVAVRAFELSAAQREKLQLAGEGDLKRLFRSIDRLRDAWAEIAQEQEKVNEFNGRFVMLRVKLQRGAVFDESSLYHKVLCQTLTKEQSARSDRLERERRKIQYEANIDTILANVADRMALRVDQRRRIVKLVLDEMEPPKKLGQYDSQVVLCQLSILKDEKLKPILNDFQMRSFKREFGRYPRMEQILREEGYLP